MPTAIPAIILAAGLGSRFRAAAGMQAPASKLLSNWQGEPMVRRVARRALEAGCAPVFVVTGHAAPEIASALAGLDVTFVPNPAYASGLASSVKAGLAALPADAPGALVLLADMPAVSADLLRRLLSEFVLHPQAAAVVPVRGGRRGNPVLLARRVFPALAAMEGDRGAGPILAAAGADVVEVGVEDEAVALDVDTPDALAQ